jgi:hypothetical protein
MSKSCKRIHISTHMRAHTHTPSRIMCNSVNILKTYLYFYHNEGKYEKFTFKRSLTFHASSNFCVVTSPSGPFGQTIRPGRGCEVEVGPPFPVLSPRAGGIIRPCPPRFGPNGISWRNKNATRTEPWSGVPPLSTINKWVDRIHPCYNDHPTRVSSARSNLYTWLEDLAAVVRNKRNRLSCIPVLLICDWQFRLYCRAYVCGDYYKTGYWIDNWIYWISQLHAITVYTLYNSLQFTKTLAESSHCIFTRLSFNIAGSVRLQLCDSSLKTAARPEYSLATTRPRNS